MRALRILVLATCLNMHFAHAESVLQSMSITNFVKEILICSAILCMADGLVEIQCGYSFLPSIDLGERSSINGALKIGCGLSVAAFIAADFDS